MQVALPTRNTANAVRGTLRTQYVSNVRRKQVNPLQQWAPPVSLLGLQSRFGDKLLRFWGQTTQILSGPQNETAGLQG